MSMRDNGPAYRTPLMKHIRDREMETRETDNSTIIFNGKYIDLVQQQQTDNPLYEIDADIDADAMDDMVFLSQAQKQIPSPEKIGNGRKKKPTTATNPQPENVLETSRRIQQQWADAMNNKQEQDQKGLAQPTTHVIIPRRTDNTPAAHSIYPQQQNTQLQQQQFLHNYGQHYEPQAYSGYQNGYQYQFHNNYMYPQHPTYTNDYTQTNYEQQQQMKYPTSEQQQAHNPHPNIPQTENNINNVQMGEAYTIQTL